MLDERPRRKPRKGGAERAKNSVDAEQFSAARRSAPNEPWDAHRVIDRREEPDTRKGDEQARGRRREARGDGRATHANKEQDHHRARVYPVAQESRRERRQADEKRAERPQFEELGIWKLPVLLDRQHDDKIERRAKMDVEMSEARKNNREKV